MPSLCKLDTFTDNRANTIDAITFCRTLFRPYDKGYYQQISGMSAVAGKTVATFYHQLLL
jgi:hypothetical protein